MNSAEQPVIVKVKHSFNANEEKVFDAWTDPAVARKFLFATDTGEMVRCDMDASTGGSFTIVERRPRDHGHPGTHDVQHIGHYVEIDRPRRLVFSFKVPQYSSEETVVALNIAPLSPGGCDLTLVHGLGSSDAAHEYRQRTEDGWMAILQNLDKALASS